MIFIIFIIALVLCVVLNLSVTYALAFGLLLFAFGAYRRGYAIKAIVQMSWDGAKRANNMVLMFLLIGMLTGVWRACGTIPWIVYYSTGLIAPRYFVLC
ncbi:MAG: sodium:proton antiporter, partial [Pygmaiobacter sp.]